LVAVAIGLWVLPRTWMLFSNALNVLLEGVPSGLDVEALRTVMIDIPGVTDIHDLHVWSLTGGRICLTAHMVAPSRATDQEMLVEEMNRMLRDRFKIGHVTLQYERAPCPDAVAGHRFL
ncbi:cation transporter, partial [Vibrio parahaemolyticus]|nr:cation transporter [Vibrio parahaemolyticus]